MKVITVRIPEETYFKLKNSSKESDRSVNATINRIVKKYLEDRK